MSKETHMAQAAKDATGQAEPSVKSGGPRLLPPIQGDTACFTCGCGSHDTMSMEALLGVGFGDCTVTRDGEQIYSEMGVVHEAEREGKDLMLWEGKDAEEVAAKDPDHDWRVHFFAPLYEAEYQRQGTAHWPLVSKGIGFA